MSDTCFEQPGSSVAASLVQKNLNPDPVPAGSAQNLVSTVVVAPRVLFASDILHALGIGFLIFPF